MNLGFLDIGKSGEEDLLRFTADQNGVYQVDTAASPTSP